MPELLECVEIETGGPVRSAVVWLHGLGANGHDFEPIVPLLGLEGRGVRFVLPHAPRRAVTVNMGLLMPAWFDIPSLDFSSRPDWRGVRASALQIEALVAREKERGVPAGRIALAGFSQGGSVALHLALRHAERLAGVVALSTFLPDDPSIGAEAAQANRGLPIFQAHGADDMMIPMALGRATCARLQALGYPVDWHAYEMEHEVVQEEIDDIGAWLRLRLAAPGEAEGR